jgi:hypothetical protein
MKKKTTQTSLILIDNCWLGNHGVIVFSDEKNPIHRPIPIIIITRINYKYFPTLFPI